MDKVAAYQDTLRTFLSECAATPYALQPGLKKQVIADTTGNHFQLMSVGWDRDVFTCHIVLHFDIVGGKVWIQQNNTEMLVADELVQRGVPQSDIVLGFQPPYARSYSGFAVA